MSTYSRIRRGPMAADAFTQIRNTVFRDPRLSAKAMGIFGNISTHRDGWGITPEGISTQMRDGVDAIRSGLKELEKCGYLQRIRTRDPETGRLGPSEYYITDQPETVPDASSEENHRSDPHRDFPHVDEPHVGNPPHKKTSTSSKNTKCENTSLSPEVVAKAEDARGRVSVTERETLASPTDKPATALPAQRAAQPQEPTQPPATTAERIIRQAAVIQPAEETAFIAWATARHQPRTPAWWRTVAKQGDLPELVAAWRSEAAQAVSQPAAVVLPPWCGVCNDGREPERPGQRMREREDGRMVKCPACHPGTVVAPAAVVSRQQQEVDDQFARQMARARARDAAREGMTITDQRVADGMALADRLAVEGNGGSSTSW